MTNEDWTARMGELYGSPFRKSDGGWGIAVYLTEQQEEVVLERHRACCDEERYGEDYLEGTVAVSIDKNGAERILTVTDGRRWQTESDWNGNRVHKCDARARTPAEDLAARWNPPEASPEARKKGRDAMAAALEDEKPKPADEAFEKFAAGFRKRTAAARVRGSADGPAGGSTAETGADTGRRPQKMAFKTVRTPRDAQDAGAPKPEKDAAAQLEKLDIPTSLTDQDAWKAWKDAVGELRGKPVKLDEGWGVQVTPTARQTALIEARQKAADDHLDLDAVLEFDHLNGIDAVSVDRSGRERTLTITDSNTYGSQFDRDGNTVWTCAAAPRKPSRYEPAKPVVRGADRAVGSGQPDPARQTMAGTRPDRGGR